MRKLLTALCAAIFMCGCTPNPVEELVRRGNVIREDFPSPEDEGLYLGNGRFGAALSSLGLTRRPLSHLQYWGRFGFTSAIEHTPTTADYLLPSLELSWENAPDRVSDYRQEQDFYDGVLRTSFVGPDGRKVKVISWFDAAEKDLAGFEVELSAGNFPIVLSVKSGFQVYPFVFRDQVEQTLSATPEGDNYRLELRYPASLNEATAVFYLYSGAPVEVDGQSVRILPGKGRNKLYLRYGAPVTPADRDNSLKRSIRGWHGKWASTGWVDFPDPEMQKVWVRSMAYLLSSYDDTETGLIQPTNGLSGYPFPFHFVQDLEYVAPALMMTGHGRIVEAWVEKFAGEIPQMQAYAKHLWPSSEGIYPPWELPFGPIEGYHEPTVPVAFCYEPHNVGYLCRLAKEAGDFKGDPDWTERYVKPLVAECCQFYLSACSRGEDGQWHLSWYPSIGQDEAGGRNNTDYLCSLYSAKYCFQTAVEMGLDADGTLSRILSGGLAFDSLLSDRGTWHTCHGADDFGIQKHPVQLDGLSYFPVEAAPLPTEAKAYALRHDITDRAREPYFFGWTLGQFLLSASNMQDPSGWLEDWSKMVPSGYTDPDWIQIRETSRNTGASFYVTTHGMIAQSLLRNYVNDYWGTLDIAACPVSAGTVRFGNIATRLGVKVSGEAGKDGVKLNVVSDSDRKLIINGETVSLKKGENRLELPKSKRASLFLTEKEARTFEEAAPGSLQKELFAAIKKRVDARLPYPALADPTVTSQWWHYVSEHMTDAALVHALEPSKAVDEWLHDGVMDLVRRSVAEWSGPPFRYYGGGPMVGGLETSHLTWTAAICLDLCGDLFSPAETAEIREAIREKGLIPCKRYIDRSNFYHNWNCIIHAGYTVAAAVLGDREALEEARDYYLHYALDHFQDDGSYGESLQYANYAAYGLMLSHEALLRSGMLAEPVEASYFGLPEWAASARFYRKPVSGWPVAALLPRSANFGDCGATFRPSGDILMHIAARSGQRAAGLSSWLFQASYLPMDAPAVHDMASFGFIPDFGFLSVLLAPQAASPVSAQEASLPLARAFSGGDAFLRNGWEDGSTVLAFRTASEPRHAVAHLHGDVNSIILSYGGERFLVDPGHACYRNISRPLDTATSSHNTCTFTLPDGTVLSQKGGENRMFDTEPLFLGGERILCESYGEVSVVADDAADLYGAPLLEFSRYAILCRDEAVFIVDKVRSDVPVKISWNWLLNNRDGNLEFQVRQPDGIQARRGEAQILLERIGAPANLNGPSYAFVHDAYHTLPGQFCEGESGSGMAFRFSDRKASRESVTLYKITLGEGPCVWEISVEDRIKVTSPEGKTYSIPLR